MEEYFNGKKLYGDDFSLDEIARWYDEEREGYSGLCAKNKQEYTYAYHEINVRHGYDKLPENAKFQRVLSLGGAYGDELQPIESRIKEITIAEPSDILKGIRLGNKPIHYVKPSVDGKLCFENNLFDLITCFGVLHHIPNVSTVLGELHRCLKQGGYLLLREPTISMGDWRSARKGMTKNERGIPCDYLRGILDDLGFEIKYETFCFFPLITKLNLLRKESVYNSKIFVELDRILSGAFRFNYRYHSIGYLKKLHPQSVFYVLIKI